jgi:2-polyprenyl-3-methyl-5-hydroxy-6-metoxy-1,4-benzoquinol methylase
MPCDACGVMDWEPLFSQHGYTLGRCPKCSLHYIDPMPEHDERMTELEGGHFAGTRSTLQADRQLDNERKSEARISEFVEIASDHVVGGRWLDIGCGTGMLPDLARRHGYKAEGIELTAARLAVARQVTGLPIHDRPLEALGFPDESFDVVSLINVFSHLTKPSETFKELRRIVRPGGIVILKTAVIESGVKKSHMFSWSLGEHLYFLGESTMERYAEDVGFSIADQRREWVVDVYYTKQRLSAVGGSAKRNAAKAILRTVPGAVSVLRAVMRRAQRDNAVYPTVFVLS